MTNDNQFHDFYRLLSAEKRGKIAKSDIRVFIHNFESKYFSWTFRLLFVINPIELSRGNNKLEEK